MKVDLSRENILDIVITTVVILVLMLFYLINEHYIRMLSKTKMICEYSELDDNIEKKNYILELCNDISFISKEKVVLTLQVNGDFLWCLENLAGSEKVNEILLLNKDSNGRFEFENQTDDLEKAGLPLGYYVVGRVEQHFLCGSVDSPRLYLFSDSLGITNTQYSDIFDYILEKLQN